MCPAFVRGAMTADPDEVRTPSPSQSTELGYVPLSQTGSELPFGVFSRRYENGATIVTSNLLFQEWTPGLCQVNRIHSEILVNCR